MCGKRIIEVEGLCKSFGVRRVIEDLNLLVEEGDVFGFLGANGAGKTTTIRLLLNLIYPDNGTIKINGFDIKTDFKRAIERVGAIVETPKFYPYLSGKKNLELLGNLIKGMTKDRVGEVLSMVELTDRADDKVKTYSLGMKQRLGIANALLNNPSLVILDEPTNGLDPQGMKEIRELVCELASRDNITFFISTHLLHEVEQMCNKAAILHNGKIVYQGSAGDFMNSGYEYVEICTDLIEETLNELSGLEYVRNTEKSSGGITVEIDKGYSGQLNRYLITKGIDVKYLIPKNQSLEAFFIEMTSGGEKVG